GVESALVEGDAENGLIGEKLRDRVGQLDLTTDTGFGHLDLVEDLGCEHVASHDREVRRRRIRRRFLDDVENSYEAIAHLFWNRTAVPRNLVFRNFHEAEDRAPIFHEVDDHSRTL